ncbi:NYN domain-containing protein [Flavobacterium azooxidireducens]|uniref:NYN domain-containing protein n=1 Tax=Flavobacterium azooxidireducens TaxID=1871076 RepID=A0ABY4KDI7_9FLAO|nr:NYN domain-containing protein [Flavobacterium azooxidireducens]UPQ78837.1 NYN domain-containing protein [Flavobacterium azooxidireducens]
MSKHDDNDLKLAVLIDADNVPFSNVKGMMEEIAKYGTPTTKRIYADWTRPNANGWKAVLLENAITPIQQYGYTTGKNSSDSALIIDAMDLLYSGKLDGFCIVSSDSDFTRLAIRLRESGMKVIGIGEQKTPKPFISACDRFIFIEVLEGAKKKKTTATSSDKRKEEKIFTKIDVDTIDIIESSIEDIADDDGWAFLGDVGNLIVKKKPEFDPRNFGFPKLTPLMKSLTHLLEIHERESDKKGIKHVYVRLK